jgi:DnaJ family protein C protein 2
MELGMKKVPASVPTKERWIKIAEMVPGKTPKECFERFKEICAKIKAGK